MEGPDKGTQFKCHIIITTGLNTYHFNKMGGRSVLPRGECLPGVLSNRRLASEQRLSMYSPVWENNVGRNVGVTPAAA